MEEALDLSFDRLLMMMMTMMCPVYRMLLTEVKFVWKKTVKYLEELYFSVEYLFMNLKNFDRSFGVVHFGNWSDILLVLLISHDVPFIASPSTTAVSHSKPASAETSRDGRHGRGTR